jgi:hypothetical protein
MKRTKKKTTGKSTAKDPKLRPAPRAAVGALAPGDAADVTEGKARGMRVKVLELVAPDKARVELPSGKTALAALSRLAKAGASAPAAPAAATVSPTVAHGRKKAARADGTMSCLDSAAKVLGQAGEALDCKTIVERAIAKGYWRTNGKTPAATLYAAILREMQKQGKAARFIKTDRGRFALNE